MTIKQKFLLADSAILPLSMGPIWINMSNKAVILKNPIRFFVLDSEKFKYLKE